MPTQSENPSITSTTFFFGCAVILLLVSLVLTVGQTFNRPSIQFGSCTLKAHIALTDQEKAKGLSGQPPLGQNEAMIFPFSDDVPGFWMKDMLFPIDIVWVNNHQVIDINAQVPPDNGTTTYLPSKPIDWVIETAAGRAAECGVQSGSTIKGLRT